MALLVSLFWFLTLSRLGSADISPFKNNNDYQDGWLGPYPTQTFFSDIEVVAPVANILVESSEPSSHDHITWTPHGANITGVGPQLLDAETLSVVYQAPMYGEDSFGMTVQTCNNTNYLVWWAGTNIDGRAAGNYYVFNSSYHLMYNVRAVGLEYGDAHDVYLTPDCHVVFTAYQPKPFELAEWNLTDNSWLLDSYFQEVDLATNELVFQWRASDHVDLHDSFWPPELEGQGWERWHGWDYIHVNSVQKDHKGNFLISARHTCAIYYIDGITGNVIWTLGGLKNDFQDLNDGRATDFSWQHHARWLDDSLTRISLFDDRSSGYYTADDSTSRGIIVELDFSPGNMTARLEAEYRAPDNITAVRKGGMQVLENGNTLLAFGSEPAVTEYYANGTTKWDVRFGPVMQDIDRSTADNYRSYLVDWVGEPYWSPEIAAGPSLNGTPITVFNGQNIYLDMTNDTAYFSWNGATRLLSWLIITVSDDLSVVSTEKIKKSGFETGIYIGNTARYVRGVALDKNDEILGLTAILDMVSGDKSFGSRIGAAASTIVAATNEWEERAQQNNSAVESFSLGAFALAFLFIILIWRFHSQIRIGFMRLLNRRGYEAIEQSPEMGECTANVVRSTRRQFSISSAIDPSTPGIPPQEFGGHQPSGGVSTDREVSARHNMKVDRPV